MTWLVHCPVCARSLCRLPGASGVVVSILNGPSPTLVPQFPLPSTGRTANHQFDPVASRPLIAFVPMVVMLGATWIGQTFVKVYP